MSKKLAVLGASLAFAASLTLPLSVSASALTSTQIDAIVSLLKSFGADSTTVSNVQMALGGSPGEQATCVDLYSNTTLGSSGAEVIKLQNYLIKTGLLDAQYNTGYYGFITAKAVGTMQLNLGVVSSASDTSYGIIGPKTRAAIACTTTQPAHPTCPIPPLMMACPAGQHYGYDSVTYDTIGCKIGHATCVPDSTSSQAPTISGLDAPASLTTGQSGTWTVHASVANQTNMELKYAVKWGDETAYPSPMTSNTAASTLVYQTSATFTHIYKTAGTYTPTFIVSNDSGSAKTSATVVASANTQSSVTINTGGPNMLPIMYKNLRPGTYARVIGVDTADFVYLPVTFNDVYPGGKWSYTNNGIASVTLNGSGQTSIALPTTFTAGNYVLELSDSSNGSLIYLRSSPFQIAPVPTQPSATIDQSSLTTSSSNPTITGTAQNTNQISLSVFGSNGEKSAYNSERAAVVSSGKWSIILSYLPVGIYTIKVYDYSTKNTLTSGTLAVTENVSTQTTISASAYPAVVKNSGGTTQLKWDITNAPSGAALEIGISGTALNATGDATLPYRNLVSPYLLDGTTRTVNLATFGQTSMPSHGTINFSPSFFSGYLPISGPVNFTVLDSNSNVLARTSAPLQITGN